MLTGVHARIKESIRQTLQRIWRIEAPEIVLNQAPKIELGELATPVCLHLARLLKMPPRNVAQDLIASLGNIEGVRRTEVAGAGYINFYLDRAKLTKAELEHETVTPAAQKVIVEHTNINPNKAAHIGHLRNAAIGDTFVRVMRAAGFPVEVQNYIDNTGVQVADVIVGFRYLENKSVPDVRRLIDDPEQSFDHYCWDLYAKMAAFYESEDPKHELRARTLRELEEGGSETAEMAEMVAMTIVRHHLRTMERINVRYDLLPRESDILHLKFWDHAFHLLKQREAIFMETEGKNTGCWVMRLDTEGYDEDKIIVRSNGTVTYVGKDIAYQLWKLGLLDQDFHYRLFQRYGDGHAVWVTCSDKGEIPDHRFGSGSRVYNVIDVRQSYLQTVVKQGLLALGYEQEAQNSVHFMYEIVALSHPCAEQLGIPLSEEDRKKPYVEVSGRKGLGVKADDLLNRLESESRSEVAKRNPDLSAGEIAELAHQIAVGALRYFLLRYTRTAIIAFDFKEALSFEGETGPYLQYSAVRANNIFKKAGEAYPDFRMEDLIAFSRSPRLATFLDEADEIWDLVYCAARLDETVQLVTMTLEPATLARFAFTLAQKFNLFYHRYRIVSEADVDRRLFYLLVVDIVRRSLTASLDLMGISVPRRM